MNPSHADASITATTPSSHESAQSPVLSHSVERAAAQYALSALRPLVFGVTRLDYGVMRTAGARTPSAASTWLRGSGERAACTAGNTSSATNQRSADGLQNRTVTTFVDHVYYDRACASLWRTETGTITTTTDLNDDDVDYSSIAGIETIHDARGRVVEVDQVSAGSDSPGNAPPSYSLSVSANTPGSGASDTFFVDCDASQCQYGDITGLATTDPYPAVGAFVIDRPDGLETHTFTGVEAFGVAGSRAATAFGGNGITGQALTRDLEAKRETSRDAAGNVTISLSLRDVPIDVASSATFSGNAISGSVERASDAFAVAKFAVDVNGYGTMTYADGTQGTIEGFGITN